MVTHHLSEGTASSNALHEYMDSCAPILFFRLDGKGAIVSMNSYARQICGGFSEEKSFRDVLIDFHGAFNFGEISDSPSRECLLSVKAASGDPAKVLFLSSRNWKIRCWLLGVTIWTICNCLKPKYWP